MAVRSLVLVAAVGFNPASILIAARVLRPSRLVLIATKDTRSRAETLCAQYGVSPAHRKIVVWPSVPSIDEVAVGVSGVVAAAPDQRVVLDITGGTKTLSIGVWQGLNEKFGDRLEAVYLEQGGQLADARTGQRIKSQCELRIEEYLAWNQAKTTSKTVWTGKLAEIPEELLDRRRVGRTLADAMRRKASLAFSNLGEGVVVDGSQAAGVWPTPLPVGFSAVPDGVETTRRGYFSNNVWLEELALAEAHEALSGFGTVRAALGLYVVTKGRGGKKGNDEMDVVLVRGARAVVIEAKARQSGRGAGADLMKRLQKARRFFGSHVTVIFVHPAWGESAPPDLQELAGRSCVLTSGDSAELQAAIRQGLGY